MDLSKIKVVIVDDDVFKGADIRKALEFNGVRDIITVRNQEKLWEQVRFSDYEGIQTSSFFEIYRKHFEE